MTYLKLMMGAASALVLTACASAPVTEPVPETLVETPASEPAMKVDVHKGDFVEIQQFVTPGGVSVWLVSEPSIPIVSVEMAWKGGETSDPEGLEGLSDAVVYNMNEGAGDLDSLGFQTRMEELNMSFGCSTGNDWTSCSASMLKENAPEAMGLIATAFDAPRFDTGPFERLQRENLIGIKQRETSAGWLARKAMTDALYPDHPYARQTSVESITALTPELAREQMRKLMVKDRLLVTAVGAVSPEELAPMIDMALGGLPETSELPPVGPGFLRRLCAELHGRRRWFRKPPDEDTARRQGPDLRRQYGPFHVRPSRHMDGRWPDQERERGRIPGRHP